MRVLRFPALDVTDTNDGDITYCIVFKRLYNMLINLLEQRNNMEAKNPMNVTEDNLITVARQLLEKRGMNVTDGCYYILEQAKAISGKERNAKADSTRNDFHKMSQGKKSIPRDIHAALICINLAFKFSDKSIDELTSMAEWLVSPESSSKVRPLIQKELDFLTNTVDAGS